MQTVRFVDIVGYEGKYQVSAGGSVMCLGSSSTMYYKPRPRVLKPDVLQFGYCQVTLYMNGVPKKFYIHRLVATAYLPNPMNYPIVNHIDNNPSNNNVENLEWCTRKHNAQHSIKCNRKRVFRGEENGNAKLKQGDIPIIKTMHKQGVRQCVIAKQFKVSFQQISKIINNQRWV